MLKLHPADDQDSGYFVLQIRVKQWINSDQPNHARQYIRTTVYSLNMTAATLLDNSLDKATSRFFRVLGDPTRIKIIELLCTSPKSVGEIVEYLGLSQARVSSHLACLRWCGFVETEKIGRHVIYSVVDDSIQELLKLARQMATPRAEHLATCTRIGPNWA